MSNNHSLQKPKLTFFRKSLFQGGLAIFIVINSVLFASCGEQQSQNWEKLIYPEPNSEATLLYLSKCGDCHAAPLPTAHTAGMWVSVVDRMQFRMISKKVSPLNEADRSSILKYLQTHANKQQP